MMSRTESRIFAHRGANREAAENTRSAFDRALEYGVDGMETDVQLTRDGVTVLWHDRFLGKLGHPVKRIDDYDYRDLQQMNFAAHFSADAKREGVMSLAEFLEAYRSRCRLLLEIKNREGEDDERQMAKVRQTLELAGAAQNDRIMVSSFHLPSLIYANHCAPGYPLVYNGEAEQTVAEVARLLESHPFLHGFCLHKAALSQAMADLLRGHGKRIAVYTCNSDAEIRHALDVGADIIISDVPQKALQMRDA
jgi:glycerophosphoryl diester phosphodiesterase